MLKIRDLTKKYKNRTVLKNINLDFKPGFLYVVMGESGVGKTTLLNIIGSVDSPTSGEILLNGKNVLELSAKEKAEYRRDSVGFIFQNYLLDNNLKVIDNVMLPLYINDSIKDKKEKAMSLLEKFHIDSLAGQYPYQLSGGEKQRVAIARALANDPRIILADEPTGNLDEKNEVEIFELLKNLSREDKCVIVVTHNRDMAKYADRVLIIESESQVTEVCW